MSTSLPILNLLRAGDIEERCRRITLAEAVCIGNAEADARQWSCNDCESCGTESDGGEPEYAISWPVCHRFPSYEHLKSFPFKRAPQRCFNLDFWVSPYAAAGIDRAGEMIPEVMEVWRQTDAFGRLAAAPAAALALGMLASGCGRGAE